MLFVMFISNVTLIDSIFFISLYISNCILRKVHVNVNWKFLSLIRLIRLQNLIISKCMIEIFNKYNTQKFVTIYVILLHLTTLE